MTIAIAGGGIAGLAAAIALARAGRAVTVYEQGRAFSELGAGIQIGPNGVRALAHLGAWEALEPSVVAPRRIVIGDGASGRQLMEIQLGKTIVDRYGAPYVVAHRADLLTALLETVKARPGIELRPGVTVTGLRVEGDQAVLSVRPGGAEWAEAVIGGDGLHSMVRENLHGRAPPDHAGHVMYRALIPAEATPTEMAADAVSLWLYPGGHVVHYSVSGGRRVNLAAFAEITRHEEDWNAPAMPAEVLGAFASAADPLRRILASAEHWQKWPAADRRPLAQWGKGAVTLIGDAAHPALPYLAQGAVMALEDAVVLGQCVARASSLPQALRDYETARLARTARLQRLSRRQGRIYHLKGPMRLARNAVLGALLPALLLRQLDWLYGWRPGG